MEEMSAKSRPGTDCGSDHELLLDCWKEMGKTTGTIQVYDYGQIPYNATVEIEMEFKGLDLIRVSEETMSRSSTTYRKQIKAILMEKCERQNGTSERYKK